MRFFSTDEDHIEILRWLYGHNEWQVFEHYSEPGERLREFHSAEQVIHAFHLGSAKRAPGTVLLDIRVPESEGKLVRRERTLKKSGLVREELAGWGLIGLHLGGFGTNAIGTFGLQRSDISVNSKKRAMAWEDTYPELGPVEAWLWSEVTRAFRRASGWIRRQAQLKVDGAPVLAGAKAVSVDGTPLLG